MQTLVLEGDEVVALATALADRTGETVTQAATIALRERLQRVPVPVRTPDERRAAIAAIQRRVAAKLATSGKRFPSMAEIDAKLYDENGLPR